MKRYFFQSSRDAQIQISSFFHFLWTMDAALWNLRWQVSGFSSAYPGCSEQDLQNRFVLGSGINGALVEKICIENTWAQNQESVARFLLFQTFGFYESWIADILDLLKVNGRDAEKGLQFPSNIAKKCGIGFTLAKLTAKPSSTLDKAFYVSGSKSNPFVMARLEKMLICYRAFKECRNCLAHEGGICSTEAKEASDAYSAITAADLGVTARPELPPQAAGTPITLTVHGCVGFTDVILKLIAMLDLELCRTAKAESVFIDVLLDRVSHNDRTRLWTADSAKRRGSIRSLIFGLGFPKPEVSDEFCEWLRSHKIVRF